MLKYIINLALTTHFFFQFLFKPSILQMYSLRSKQQRRSTRLIPKKVSQVQTIPKKVTQALKKAPSNLEIPDKNSTKLNTKKKTVTKIKEKPKVLKPKGNCVLSNSSDGKQKFSDKELEDELARLSQHGTFDLNDSAAGLINPVLCMKRHEKLKCTVISDFCACLETYGNNKWKPMLKEVPFQITDGTIQDVPMILVVCSGEPNNTKVAVANKALIDWNLVTKKKVGKSGCEWYEPATQNQRIRTFFGETRKKYGWKLKQHDFNYRSMLNPVLERLYQKRRGQFKVVDYGIPNSNKRLTEYEINMIDLEKLNEDDPRQHIIKLAFVLGTQLGLRGGEYNTLEVSNITHGVFQ